jgi:Tol biopolymer transport system component/C-terminal processing protease CtpA/Prc
MQRLLFITALLCVSLLPLAALTPPTPQPAMTQPSLSPDGRTIAFAAGSAIWTVPAAGGAAHLLIADDATASRPMFSPDGRWLAFNSTRTGGGDIYLFEPATGQLRRLTYDDGMEALDGWSTDSQWVYFSSSSRNIGGMNDVYRVRSSGGTPMIVASERYQSEYYAAAAPDGSIAFCTVGEQALSQWWRNGEAHIDQTEIWSVTPTSGAYARLVAGGAKQIWPMWTPDGHELYFMSDRGGSENIWVAGVGTRPAAPRQLTDFKSGRVLWPSIAANGKTIVFESDFGIWQMDVASHRATPVSIHLEGAPASPSPSAVTLNTATDYAVAPDGKKVAFTAHGEIFANGTEEGGPAIQVTRSGHLQSQMVWSPDSRTLVYVSDRNGTDHLYEYDFAASNERQLTKEATADDHPIFSPDGKWLAFQRGATELMVLSIADDTVRELAKGYFESPTPLGAAGGQVAFSPDSRDVGFMGRDSGGFRNAFIAPVGGGASRQVSFLANTNGSSLSWSPDGQFLIFQTTQRTEPDRIARVDLIPQAPVYNEDRFQALFKEQPGADRGERGRGGVGAPKTTPPPTKVEYDGIEQRLSLLPMTDARGPVISPDGKWLAYVGTPGGGTGGSVVLYSLERLPPGAAPAGGRGGRGGGESNGPRQLTSTPGVIRDLQFTADSKEIYYLEGGRVSHIAVAGSTPPRAVTFSASMEVNFDEEKNEIFDQAWRYLRDNYMNEGMNGTNWNDVRSRYAPVVAGSRTPDDLRWVLSEMIGELNSSHSGISAGTSSPTRPPRVGHVGVYFDRARYESAGALCMSEIVPQGPAALAGVQVGDCISALDGVPIDKAANFDQLMAGTIGHKVSLTLARNGAPVIVSVQPASGAGEKNLIYTAWVEHNRKAVEKLSHGTLGYVHMNDMSQASLDRLYLDLDSANFGRQGVVIDIRNNNGGFVNAYALDVLTRRPYLSMIRRGFPSGSARVALGQRALERPTVLITNQNSLSDAEDFTEGYRTLGLGKVVGLPTAGWIIYTSNVTLIDGSSLRLPNTRVLDHAGKDMELHPRPVDVEVQNPPGSWAAGHDPQLETAVTTLLAQLASGAEGHGHPGGE